MFGVLLGGCGPVEGETVGSETTAGPTTEATGQPTTEATEATGGTTAEPTGGESMCAPGPVMGEVECQAPGETYVYWNFTVAADDGAPYDELCSVDAVSEDGATTSIEMTCAGEPETLVLYSEMPHVNVLLPLGGMARMQLTTIYDDEVPDSWFALRDVDDNLLVAGLANAVLPGLAPLKISPLTLDLKTTTCDSFEGECFVLQQTALAVDDGENVAVVFGGNVGVLGEQAGYEVLVADSTRDVCYIPDCGYSYSPWSTNALIFRSSEG